MEISVNCDGDLRMDFTARLFNSPVVPEKLYSRECPKQTYFQLWNYEVLSENVYRARLKGFSQVW